MAIYSEMELLTQRQRDISLRAQLEFERTSFIAHWRELAEYILPRRPRWFTSDTNRGERRNQKIIDGTGTLASRTLRSGMMGGVTSPARPWFRLTTPDPALAEFGPVKIWLDIVTKQMVNMFLRSNLYNSLPTVYGDMGVFATSAMMVEESFKGDVLRTYPFPIGSYFISNNSRGSVDTFVRDQRFTVRQIVEKFGKKRQSGAPDWSNFSSAVKSAYDSHQYETWIDVCHVIEPNRNFNDRMIEAKFKRFRSAYFEKGSQSGQQSYSLQRDAPYLRESGYDRFPVLAPRWETTGEDFYGNDCPGMAAIGDIKQLQLMQKRKAQAIEKIVNPPMTAPTALRTAKTSILPGDVTYVDTQGTQNGFKPAHEVNIRLGELTADIQDIRHNIQRAFYEDLFLMLANDQRLQPRTAEEIVSKREEKLLALGPVLEQLNQDLLDPLIDIAFDYMVRQDMVPPAPDEIQGSALKVEYVSVMAQAQKLVGIAGIERFVGFVGGIGQTTGDPSTMDKADWDQTIDVYGDRMGVDVGIIRSDEQVENIRESRAKAQQAAQAIASAREIASTAKDLAGSDLESDNALKRVLQQSKAGEVVPS